MRHEAIDEIGKGVGIYDDVDYVKVRRRTSGPALHCDECSEQAMPNYYHAHYAANGAYRACWFFCPKCHEAMMLRYSQLEIQIQLIAR